VLSTRYAAPRTSAKNGVVEPYTTDRVGVLSRTARNTPTTISHAGNRKKPKMPSGVSREAPITVVAQASHVLRPGPLSVLSRRVARAKAP
jgi:hypothetical protein